MLTGTVREGLVLIQVNLQCYTVLKRFTNNQTSCRTVGMTLFSHIHTYILGIFHPEMNPDNIYSLSRQSKPVCFFSVPWNIKRRYFEQCSSGSLSHSDSEHRQMPSSSKHDKKRVLRFICGCHVFLIHTIACVSKTCSLGIKLTKSNEVVLWCFLSCVELYLLTVRKRTAWTLQNIPVNDKWVTNKTYNFRHFYLCCFHMFLTNT